MRIIGTLFLIAFVATTIYFTKDDAFGLLNRVINKEDKITIVSPQPETEEATPLETTTPSSQFDREVIAPGPLKQEGFGSPHEDTQTLNAIRVITATNTARKNNGVSLSLEYNAKLEQAAQVKLQDLFAKNYFEHVSPSGVSVSDLGTQAGYDYITIGENLALGDFESEQELVTAWMNSPGHRANILNTKYRDIGVAVGYGRILGQNTWVAVQHFGVSVDLCPKVSTTLRNEIAADEMVLKEQATTLEAQKRDIEESEVYERDYQDKVDAYNSGVEAYNSLVQIAKEKIIRYNNQVNAFNACVAAP